MSPLLLKGGSKLLDNFINLPTATVLGEHPRSREAFEHLWYNFEEVLADLVGSYLKLLEQGGSDPCI